MTNDGTGAGALAARGSAGLRRALRQLPEGGLERQAVEAGEIDAIIDYGSANVIMFPCGATRAARRGNSCDAPQPRPRQQSKALRPTACSPPCLAPSSERLLPDLEPVMLELGDVLHEPGAPIRYVYFPVDCAVCLLTKTESQRAVATGMVGYEGMVGTSLALRRRCVVGSRLGQSPAGKPCACRPRSFTKEFQPLACSCSASCTAMPWRAGPGEAGRRLHRLASLRAAPGLLASDDQ